jgi:hypothetical protein
VFVKGASCISPHESFPYHESGETELRFLSVRVPCKFRRLRFSPLPSTRVNREPWSPGWSPPSPRCLCCFGRVRGLCWAASIVSFPCNRSPVSKATGSHPVITSTFRFVIDPQWNDPIGPFHFRMEALEVRMLHDNI